MLLVACSWEWDARHCYIISQKAPIQYTPYSDAPKNGNLHTLGSSEPRTSENKKKALLIKTFSTNEIYHMGCYLLHLCSINHMGPHWSHGMDGMDVSVGGLGLKSFISKRLRKESRPYPWKLDPEARDDRNERMNHRRPLMSHWRLDPDFFRTDSVTKRGVIGESPSHQNPHQNIPSPGGVIQYE